MKNINSGSIKKHWYLLLVLVIFLFAFWVRSFPARFGELQALDPFYFYRVGDYLIHHNLQLPEKDMMANYPFGDTWDFSVPIYVPPAAYLLISAIGIHMNFLYFAIIWPAVLGALSVILMFFIGKEVYNYKVGLLSSFFLAVVPAFITRTSAGFFDKEPTAGLLILLSIYLFIKSFKNKSLKYGILSGISFAVMSMSWGGIQHIYIFFAIFAFFLLLLNRDTNRLAVSYLPSISIGLFLTQFGPKTIPVTSTGGLLSAGVFTILAVRYAVERFRLVKKDKIVYVAPVLIISGFVAFLIGAMFSDYLYGKLQSAITLILVQYTSPIGYTVAENAPGNFGHILETTSSGYSAGLLPQLGFIIPYFSIWIFMFLGLFLIIYKVAIRKNFLLILPAIWLLSSFYSVFYAVRLLFLVGPPAALVAGFSVGWVINRYLKLDFIKKIQEAEFNKKLPYLIPLALFLILLILINTANAYKYSRQMGPSICFPREGEKCLTIDAGGNLHYAKNQPWYQAMDFLRYNTTEGSSVISWWDFGYWFEARGMRPSISDGGHGPRYEIATWFTADAKNWTDFEPWLIDERKVDYILMDYTLPGKYGAISAIATDGKGTVGIVGFQRSGIYPKGNKTIYEFRAGQYAIWLPIQNGSIAGTPMFLVSQGGQYMQSGYISDVCTTNGIIKTGQKTPDMGGCLALSSMGVFYVPPPAKNTIFTSLMFMDGYGLPVKKVFDNTLIKIYRVEK
jgi:dolichyl-diphosphooligosaccharide--protein glycosyltransferase